MSQMLDETKEKRIIERRRKNRISKISSVAMPILGIVMLFLIWELWVILGDFPAWQISRPSLIIRSMLEDFELYWPNIVRTFTSILTGWVAACLIGVVMGALMANYALLGTTLTPYINLLCTLPVITLVPMMYVFMGIGRDVIIIAIILQSFAIVTMNSSTGFMNVPVMRIELMTSLRATKRQTFFQCMFPSAINNVFTGMKLSAIFATTTCVAAEVNGSTVGLGALVIEAKTYVRTDQMFGSILFIAIIGVFFYMLSDALEAVLVKWKE